MVSSHGLKTNFTSKGPFESVRAHSAARPAVTGEVTAARIQPGAGFSCLSPSLRNVPNFGDCSIYCGEADAYFPPGGSGAAQSCVPGVGRRAHILRATIGSGKKEGRLRACPAGFQCELSAQLARYFCCSGAAACPAGFDALTGARTVDCSANAGACPPGYSVTSSHLLETQVGVRRDLQCLRSGNTARCCRPQISSATSSFNSGSSLQ